MKGSKNRIVLALALIASGSSLLSQQQYPPINRDIEMHEKSARGRRSTDPREIVRRFEEARSAAADLEKIADRISLVPYPAGSADPKGSSELLRNDCKEWRKRIRPVQEISFLDPSEEDRPEKFEKAMASVDFEVLQSRLKSLSAEIRKRVDSLAGHGVAVDSLKTPSLEALIESGKRLSKALGDSGRK